MKRIGSVVLCCIGVAAVGTGAALADSGNSTPNPNQVAAQQCTASVTRHGREGLQGAVRRPAQGQARDA